MLIFQGCAANVSGKCDVVAEFELVAPDGARTPGGAGPVWSDELARGRLQLGKANMTVGFDATDVAGMYKVVATVKDVVSGQILQLTTPLKVE